MRWPPNSRVLSKQGGPAHHFKLEHFQTCKGWVSGLLISQWTWVAPREPFLYSQALINRPLQRFSVKVFSKLVNDVCLLAVFLFSLFPMKKKCFIKQTCFLIHPSPGVWNNILQMCNTQTFPSPWHI